MRKPKTIAVTKTATTNLGASNNAEFFRRWNIGGAVQVREALQYIRLIGPLRTIQLLAFLPLVSIVEYWIPRFSEVETTPFIDPRQFDFHEFTTSAWTQVRSELDAVLERVDTLPRFQDIAKEATLLTDDDRWRPYLFYLYGHRFDKQCAQCPDTDRVLQQIPGLSSAYFSILLPGKRIPPHRGPYRGFLRYHLALLVPDHGECGIRVGDHTAKWEQGVGIMFDDTYEHEVWNDTEQVRVVLFLDIARPMKFPFNLVNSAVITLFKWSPFVRDAAKNQAAWDRR
jgi:hypothetical protein